ncbi:unnamed protein product [Angiostrongylus costaricensis]|uniref:Ovule protein n=1 Tax=Angiostrongylus costaricensis TaxID=334426 RepID=A0A0R3PM42_ANGCS|nr:unnamed protein product [Angiostrongylus costaricensis]
MESSWESFFRRWCSFDGRSGRPKKLQHIKKRFEGLGDYMEDPTSKRTSLKRLAILSARGFGKK